jgi:tRNA dimethylallyltransferase
VAAGRIHPGDRRRVIRALEIAAAGGRAATGWNSATPAPWAGRLLVLDRPRRLLAERIDRRVEAMFAGGVVEEVAGALAAGGLGPTARQAAGYAECLDLLAGRCTRAAAITRTQQRTRQLAKRQLTWLRSFPEATWISG